MEISQTAEKIIFDEPANNWNEAFPIGNGRLGGMIYGYSYTERIQLNEDSVWFGGPRDRINPSALEKLPEIRRLIFEGKISEANELCALALSGIPEEVRHYEPLGDLYVDFYGRDYDKVTDYRRELDISTATACISYKKSGVTFKREIIASFPDNVMIMHVTADVPGSISFQAHLSRGAKPWFMAPVEGCGLRRAGCDVFADRIETADDTTGFMTAASGGAGGCHMAAAFKVVVNGGSCEAIGNTVVVTGADEALLILAADTTFREKDPLASSLARVRAVSAKTWDELLSAHTADYKSLYDRVTLDIKGAWDVVRFFQFGRYLLIASSRPGSLPANLQGIWNQDYDPAWGSHYTININAEMNYWPALTCNLAECQEPLFDLIERMRPSGREAARRMYGCRGFMAHHNTDIWGDCAPQDICLSATYWVMGAAWLCTHLWEHYLFTRDTEFLRKSYPTMQEAALFIVDFLVEDGEYLVTCPTLSPENTYILPNGERGNICKGASMDNQIITQLLSACVEAEKILGIKDGCSEEFTKTLEKIAPIRVGKHGQIMEWNEDYDEQEPGHRHISQLFALYPGDQITSEKSPELMEAARKTIERRLSFGGGHSGWSRAWIINMYARLGEGDKALENIQTLIAKQTLPNLFDNHPPFQIDGNFGCTAGIAEMLVQSHESEIRLLPALPAAWTEGRVTGLRLRGNKILKELVWKDGQVQKAVIEDL